MGKRSSFKRIEKDFYRTIDKRAVSSLLPFLMEGTRFIEPCAGYGDLMTELEKHGHHCVIACDNNPLENPLWDNNKIVFQDAFNIDYDSLSYDCIVTNPPWTRHDLHNLITHWMQKSSKPVWLLFDSDWAFTKQSSDLTRRYLTDIVAIGRLIWIPGTKMSGKDNCSWYRFSQDKYEDIRFHGRV